MHDALLSTFCEIIFTGTFFHQSSTRKGRRKRGSLTRFRCLATRDQPSRRSKVVVARSRELAFCLLRPDSRVWPTNRREMDVLSRSIATRIRIEASTFCYAYEIRLVERRRVSLRRYDKKAVVGQRREDDRHPVCSDRSFVTRSPLLLARNYFGHDFPNYTGRYGRVKREGERERETERGDCKGETETERQTGHDFCATVSRLPRRIVFSRNEVASKYEAAKRNGL